MGNVYEAFSLGDPTLTGKVLADFTIVYCKTMSGAAVSQAGMTLTELGAGDYSIMNPNVVERTICRGYLTADSTKRFAVNLDPVDGNIAQETSVARILGLVLHNHVEDDIVRDANGLKTSATIYCYNSAANATMHDKATGLIAKYTVTPAFTNRLMTLLKSVQVV